MIIVFIFVSKIWYDYCIDIQLDLEYDMYFGRYKLGLLDLGILLWSSNDKRNNFYLMKICMFTKQPLQVSFQASALSHIIQLVSLH